MIKEEEDDKNKVRKLAIKEMENFDKLAAENDADYKVKTKQAEAELSELRKKVKVAEDNLGKLFAKCRERNVFIEREKNRLRTFLFQSYPPAIDQFIHDMRELSVSNSKKIILLKQKEKGYFSDDPKNEITTTNIPNINLAAEYIRNAIQEAEQMKVMNLSDVDVDARLDSLRKDIPDIKETTEIIRRPADISELNNGGRSLRPVWHPGVTR
jgi:hypothetical protein